MCDTAWLLAVPRGAKKAATPSAESCVLEGFERASVSPARAHRTYLEVGLLCWFVSDKQKHEVTLTSLVNTQSYGGSSTLQPTH
jgi:hypothetical protein